MTEPNYPDWLTAAIPGAEEARDAIEPAREALREASRTLRTTRAAGAHLTRWAPRVDGRDAQRVAADGVPQADVDAQRAKEIEAERARRAATTTLSRAQNRYREIVEGLDQSAHSRAAATAALDHQARAEAALAELETALNVRDSAIGRAVPGATRYTLDGRRSDLLTAYDAVADFRTGGRRHVIEQIVAEEIAPADVDPTSVRVLRPSEGTEVVVKARA